MSELDLDDDGKWLEKCEVVFARPAVRFSDIGGMDDVKKQIRIIAIEPFKHPELYKAYGRKIGGGVLLYGPPGCGKTLFARALAGECAMNFTQIEIASVLNWEEGPIVANLHTLFEEARRNVPSLIFIDEIDALLPSRARVEGRELARFVNQFLVELDGVASNNEGILIVGSTNRPWDVDDAARRPGRFDRKIFVPPPDEVARREILKIHLKGKPVNPNLPLDEIAQRTRHYSGADLKAVVDQAVEAAILESLRDARKSGAPAKPSSLTASMLCEGLTRVKPSTLDWIESAKNYVTFSNQGGYWDDIKEWLNGGERHACTP